MAAGTAACFALGTDPNQAFVDHYWPIVNALDKFDGREYWLNQPMAIIGSYATLAGKIILPGVAAGALGGLVGSKIKRETCLDRTGESEE